MTKNLMRFRVDPTIYLAPLIVLVLSMVSGAPAVAGQDSVMPAAFSQVVELTFDHGEGRVFEVVAEHGQTILARLEDGQRLRIVPLVVDATSGRVDLRVSTVVATGGADAGTTLESAPVSQPVERILVGQVGFLEHLPDLSVTVRVDAVRRSKVTEYPGPSSAQTLEGGIGSASDAEICCVTCDGITYCGASVVAPCGSCTTDGGGPRLH